MKFVVQQPKPPQALRLLLQADDDADGIEVALAAAEVWAGDRLVVVINGTGKDLSGFAIRHRFAVLCDDAERPTRSLTEIAEAFESLDREQVGAVVALDTNRIYRATRCSVRNIEDLKSLSPGHWDDTNEALGRIGELITRAGVPSIFVAPPSDVYGVGEDGDQIVVGSKPQAWKDLARQAHAQLKLARRGRELEVEIAGDDWRRLGQPGEVVTITGESLGRRFADLAEGRAGVAAGTTLEEATAAELAARTRRAERRRANSEQARDRLAQLAQLRAYQGPEAWARHVEEVASAVGTMAPDDAETLHARMAGIYKATSADIEWMRMAEQTLELSPYSLHASARWQICGPSINACPARDDMPVAGSDPAEFTEAALTSSSEDLPAWIGSLAQHAGVWSEPSFAVVCKANRLTPKGESWERYTDAELRELVRGLAWLASLRTVFDPPEAPRHASVPVLVEAARPTATDMDEPIWAGQDAAWEPVEDDDIRDAPIYDISEVELTSDEVDKFEAFISRSASGQGMTVARASPRSANGVSVELPDPAAFVVLPEQAQRDTVAFVLQQVGAFEDWDRFRRGTAIGGSKSPRRWDDDERALIYRTALANLSPSGHREAA